MCLFKLHQWVWCFLTFIFISEDIRSVALLQKGDGIRRCYSCGQAANNTAEENCEDLHNLIRVHCLRDKPYCVTSSFIPYSKPSMSCSNNNGFKGTCNVSNSTGKSQISCICNSDFCNSPFSDTMKDILNTYINSNKTKELDLTNLIANNISQQKDVFQNINKITVSANPQPEKTTVQVENNQIKAEALKDGETSDDDDDEGGGSGSYEDQKTHVKPIQTAPEPSSYLPSNENKASDILVDYVKIVVLVLTTSLFV